MQETPSPPVQRPQTKRLLTPTENTPTASIFKRREQAIDLAKRFEGFCRVPKSDPDRAYPYVCPAGFWTIGYGHLCDAKHPPINMEEGEAYLAADMAEALRATLRYCPVLATEPEGRLAAIVDFTFNLGAGGCRRQRFGAGSISGIEQVRRTSCVGGFTVEAECCRGWCSGECLRRLFCWHAAKLDTA